MPETIEYLNCPDVCREVGISPYLLAKLEALGKVRPDAWRAGKELFSASRLPEIRAAVEAHKKDPRR